VVQLGLGFSVALFVCKFPHIFPVIKQLCIRQPNAPSPLKMVFSAGLELSVKKSKNFQIFELTFNSQEPIITLDKAL